MILKNSKKIVLTLFLIISSFFIFSKGVSASSIDKKFIDNGVFLKSGWFNKLNQFSEFSDILSNEITDAYEFDVENADFNTKFLISYREDGLYFNDTLLYSSSTDFLNKKWAFVYIPSSHIFYLYVYSNYKQLFNMIDPYQTSFPFSSQYLGINSCEPTGVVIDKWTINTSNVIKFSESISNTCLAYSGLQSYIYGTNNVIASYQNDDIEYNHYTSTKHKFDPTPKAKYELKENTTIINDVTYTISNDVTVTVDNFDINKHLYQYQFVKKDGEISDNWITYDLTSNNSFTLNFKENGTIISRVLDLNDNYKQIYSNTYTFDNISNVVVPPSTTFSSKNNTITIDNENRIISKDVTINVNYFDNDKYIFQYQFVKDDVDNFTDNWQTYTFTNSNSFTLHFIDNGAIYVQILDKDNNYVSGTTYSFSDINNLLRLNKIYNSGEVYGYDLYSLNITNFNTNSLNYDIPFRIQFGTNDFNIDNMPFIATVRGYYYNTTTQQKTLTDDVYIKDLVCNKTTASETICEGTMTKKHNKPTYYEIIFSNTDNYYLNYYDYFDNSYRNVDITTNLFKDYNKYYFNANSNQAYINLKNINQSNKKGSVIIPYYFLNNDDLKIKLRKFNLKDNSFGSEYSPYFLNDKYYKKIDFEINDNYIPVLTNKKGRYCNTFYINSDKLMDIASNYKGYFLNFNNNKLYTIFDITSLSLYSKETICYEEETVFFYVHKDFKITFNTIDSSDNVTITDENGNVIVDIDGSVNSEILYEDYKSFFDSVKESFEYFSTPFREIFNMISYFWNLLAMPLKLLFIFIFVIILALFIFKFLL